ncbi:outer membrane protein assembly factor BamD [Herbaspirillum sp. RTI4]|uniref:outer membrane protein assembly factor BamD n=1 Tax=Herbaspirillum sp. RTI4 TaxID=3048640 RepID=UPI002AB5AB26|nr:outer membrane protein assembly factor BamD [Herbaspirillum sp. RTI4]MDY7578561.1 outer membrane protein assembly factor BamD [Herbaspirillum sp. RTI4]MEA9981133.1 outer membrane protein assembly factor BamD [Herbaspirillum sp. RTI4]
MQKILLKCIATAIALSFALSACGLIPEQKDETVGWSAGKLYAEAKDELDQGGYEKSIKYFEKLESRFPFGTFAQQAQMDIAYAHYRLKEQPEALAAADRFIKLHPNHPNVDYMYYLRGLVNFNEHSSIFDIFSHQDDTERDPKAMRDAFDSFKMLATKFPNSPYTPDAIARMKYLINAMVQHEVHVAEYYYRRGAYISAVNRAQAAVSDYPNSEATTKALYIMRDSYNALGQNQLRDDTDRIIKNSELGIDPRNAPKDEKSPWWKIW